MPRFAPKPRRPGRIWLLLLGLLRAITLVFALHLGGLVHDTSDLLSAVTAEPNAEHEQCPADGPCDDCPPGCPNCHCGTLGSLEPVEPLAVLPWHPRFAQSRSFELAEAKAGPELPSLFRPPRS